MSANYIARSGCMKVFSFFILLFFCNGGIHSQCNLLCNTDFEDLQITSSVTIVDTVDVPCWGTTASDNKIEVWHTGFNGVPSYSGSQFIELNAFFVSTLFQNFTSTPGTLLTISFAHRGRVGTDVMSVEVGPVGGPYTTLGTFTDGNAAWGYYTVNYTVPSGMGNTFSLRFNSVSAAGGNPALGNFLDAISVNLPSSATLGFSTLAASCAGSHDGSAIVSVITGSGPYSYTWAPTGVHTNSLSSATAGIYTVYVSESNGCTTSGTVQVGPGAVLSTSITSQNESCPGAHNGSAQVVVFGNGFPTTYTWSPGGIHSATATGLSPGIYSVQVSNAAGCTASNTVLISPGISLSATVTAQNVSCFGLNDGTAQVVASGGSSFTYTWSPGGASTASVTGLSPGIYTVQTSSSTGCLGTNTVAINQGPSLTFSVTTQSATCFGLNDGAAQIVVSGGAAPYTYTWMPSGGNLPSATGLSGGTYTIISKSSNSCIISPTVFVSQGPSLTTTLSSQGISCLGANDGAAQVLVGGGTGPYSYTWSPVGGNTANAVNLSAGAYTVYANSFNGCAAYAIANISEGAALSVAVVQQPISCTGAADGAAQVFVSGGSGAYSYTWAPSALTTTSISGLAPGSYTVQTSSANGCAGVKSFSVIDGPALNLAAVTTSPSCFGIPDGGAGIFVSGGVAPYTYTWSPVASSTSTLAGLPAGSYTVQATSSNGCTGNTVFNIVQPLPLSSSSVTQSVSCTGGANGKAEVFVSGGTAPYSYTWVPSGINSPSLSISLAGTYTCMITDHNLCSPITTTVVIVNAPSPTLSVTSSTICAGKPAILNVYGALSYTWFPGNANGAEINVSPLTSTSYSVIGENSYGCTDTVITSVFVSNYPLAFAGNDTTVNMDEPVTLVGTGSDFYGWIPMNGGNVLTCNLCHTITENPQQNTCYVLEAYNEFNCRNSDTVCVTVTEDWNIYIPNAFTPNNNGINDVFIPVGYGIEDIELFIFDRWGSLIFSSDDKTKGWNGTYKNVICKPDVYVYKVSITTMNHHEEYRTGHVTLLK